MSADKRPSKAEVFAGWLEGRVHLHQHDRDAIAAELRRIPALEADRDQLRAELAARKEADTRSTIAAWDQIKRLQGEASVLRGLLAEAREVLGTIDSVDAPNEMDALLAALDAAINPTSRDDQQMVIIEVAKTKALHG